MRDWKFLCCWPCRLHDIPCSLKMQALCHSRIWKNVYQAEGCYIPEEIAFWFQNSFHVRKYCASFPPVGALLNFMFEFPCIITLYYIKNQQDATLAVLFISHCKITLHVSDAFCTAMQWQPTSDILTGYISSRPMARTSGCYYSF